MSDSGTRPGSGEPTAALLGTGLLGSAIARRVAESGIHLKVWNRTVSKAEALRAWGISVCATPAEACEDVDVVLVCLRDGAAVESVLTSGDGGFERARPDTVFADISTVGPRATRRLLELASSHGYAYVATPVVGSGTSALGGQLVVLEGGDRSALGRARRILEPTARRFFYCGSPELASAAKLAVNTLLGLLNEAIAEAYALGLAMGIESSLLLDILSETPAGSQVERKRALIESGNFEPSFKLELLAKDLRLALEEASANGVAESLEGLRATLANVDRALSSGWEGRDYSGMAGFLAPDHSGNGAG
jgi:3-hydroxyisobutyrate dehydrogenase